MSPYKRIIPLFTAIAICFSSMITPSFASLVPSSGYLPVDFSTLSAVSSIDNEGLGIFENASGYLATLYEAMTSGECDGCTASPIGKHNFMPGEALVQSWLVALKGEEACVCRYCGISYRDFYKSTYNSYVNDLPTPTIDNTGFLYFKIPFKYGSLQTMGENSYIYSGKVYFFGNLDGVSAESTMTWYDVTIESMFDPTSIVYRDAGVNKYGWAASLTLVSEDYPLPIDGYYSFPDGLDASYTAIDLNGSSHSATTFAEFDSSLDYYSAGTLHRDTLSSTFDIRRDRIVYGTVFAGSHYYRCKPLDGLIDVVGDTYYGIFGRPTTIIGNYGIIGDDGTLIKVDGDFIVDESTNIVYNPVTNNTYNFTEYTYDYSDRSYNLTLEDGSSIKVVYGDENITIHEGDTIYNVYYLVPDDVPGTDDPGTDNPDDPDNPGTDADVSGFFAWWKNAWNGFVDRLFTVLDGGDLEVILPGEEGNPEDEEDDGWTVFDLFALIRDALWKIITGVITVVLDGFLGLVDAIASLGDFFDIYDTANPNGIFGVPDGGVDLWS